ncbi:hypothetical protein BBJ28_00024715 [Nothophytophthora sp. Chile5]|nr:hypothetical protein BBJ28_00024715 [Nothophytophthora sp. Chile5]
MALAQEANFDAMDFGRELGDLEGGSDLGEGSGLDEDSGLDEGSDVDSETPEPSVTSAPTPTAPTPIVGQQILVAGNEKCGGRDFNYTMYMPEDPATSSYTTLTCEAGYRCLRAEVWADGYECQEWPSPEPVPFYGQCGGSAYDGQTMCTPGCVCNYVSESFSQCLPTY